MLNINKKNTVVIELIQVNTIVDPLSYVYDEPLYDYGMSIVVILINSSDETYINNFLKFKHINFDEKTMFDVQLVYYDGRQLLEIDNLHTVTNNINLL